MKQGKDIVRRVLAVDITLLKEITGAMLSYLKVLLLPKLDVVGVDRDEVVHVRPGVLVHEAESVKQLMDRGCQARVETGAEIVWNNFCQATL